MPNSRIRPPLAPLVPPIMLPPTFPTSRYRSTAHSGIPVLWRKAPQILSDEALNPEPDPDSHEFIEKPKLSTHEIISVLPELRPIIDGLAIRPRVTLYAFHPSFIVDSVRGRLISEELSASFSEPDRMSVWKLFFVMQEIVVAKAVIRVEMRFNDCVPRTQVMRDGRVKVYFDERKEVKGILKKVRFEEGEWGMMVDDSEEEEGESGRKRGREGDSSVSKVVNVPASWRERRPV